MSGQGQQPKEFGSVHQDARTAGNTVFELPAVPHYERYSKPHVIEKKKSARAASNASW
jgi:hypothetical protein